jgi:hypothetical protein
MCGNRLHVPFENSRGNLSSEVLVRLYHDNSIGELRTFSSNDSAIPDIFTLGTDPSR